MTPGNAESRVGAVTTDGTESGATDYTRGVLERCDGCGRQTVVQAVLDPDDPLGWVVEGYLCRPCSLGLSEFAEGDDDCGGPTQCLDDVCAAGQPLCSRPGCDQPRSEHDYGEFCP